MDNRKTGLGAVEIRVPPSRLSEFCRKHRDILAEKQAYLAGNAETGYSIYLTLCADDESANYPRLMTYRYDTVQREDCACSKEDAEDRYQQLIRWYLLPVSEDDDTEEEYDDDLPEDPEDRAFERSDALYQSMLDHLSEVLDIKRVEVEDTYGNDIVYDCLDNLCGFLRDSYGISVYYPVVEREDGVVTVIDYPYDG